MQGLRIDEAQGNKINLPSDYNMIGELYMEMDKLSDAQNYFFLAESASKEVNERQEEAGAYYNLGLLFKRKSEKNKAREYLRQAQELYKLIDENKYEEVKKTLLSFD